MSTAELEALEALIDSYDVARVLEAIAEICHEKASHLRENWGDPVSAREWTKDAMKINALSRNVNS